MVRPFRFRVSNLFAAALREIERIYRYIAQFNPHAATNLANQILAAGDSLERLPFAAG